LSTSLHRVHMFGLSKNGRRPVGGRREKGPPEWRRCTQLYRGRGGRYCRDRGCGAGPAGARAGMSLCPWLLAWAEHTAGSMTTPTKKPPKGGSCLIGARGSQISGRTGLHGDPRSLCSMRWWPKAPLRWGLAFVPLRRANRLRHANYRWRKGRQLQASGRRQPRWAENG
jgi:hypothetical protein